ncbi:MAG: exodeoxyribonuclease VII large subunit [Verrucomicrobia bacterium]|nr:exodeoxyribonuclease VII large subunit [Verrucomicrobiota bacterium]
MGKVKSQWDFGELFPTEATRKVLTVGELTMQIKRTLEKQVGQVWVTGEVTNLRAQSSGHIYFTLKDASAQLSCVLFRGEAQASRDLLQDGQKIIVQGELTVYEPRGQYQLRVVSVELQGIGALQLAFEKLKQKLQAEGLFAPERKRPLPRYPQRIGLVTSPTGAAIRDVLHVIQRRNPALEIILAPCRVQGEGAAEEIAAAIRLLNEFNAGVQASACRGDEEKGNKLKLELQPDGGIDLLLVTRGGGSLEDLWASNEEVVARAIFESALPVVSAVGHEIDFTISDFVADVRAATPSAAAEIITEGVFASRRFLSEVSDGLRQRMEQRVARERESLEQLAQRVVRTHPRRRLNEKLQQLDDLQGSLSRCVRQGTRNQRVAWQTLAERLLRVRPALILGQRRESLRQKQRRLHEQGRHRVEELRSGWTTLEARLRLLSPEQVLSRGYSITMDVATGKVLRAADQTRAGQRLKTRLHSGEVISRVEN